MKKTFFSFMIAFFVLAAGVALADSLVWENTNPVDVAVDGSTVYFSATDGTDPAGGGEYNVNVAAGTYTYAIPDLNLESGKEYQFEVEFYNSAGNSERAGPVLYVSDGYVPPGDNLPTAIYTAPGVPVNITINP